MVVHNIGESNNFRLDVQESMELEVEVQTGVDCSRIITAAEISDSGHTRQRQEVDGPRMVKGLTAVEKKAIRIAPFELIWEMACFGR